MIVDLVRLETDFDSGTFGALLIDGELFCTTLEPYEYGNTVSKSCIPEGQYECRKIISPSFGDTFEVCHVPNRSHVLFHKGNTKNNTEGCIILGQYPDKLRHQRALMNSGETFNRFLNLLAGMGVNEFKLCIKAVW